MAFCGWPSGWPSTPCLLESLDGGGDFTGPELLCMPPERPYLIVKVIGNGLLSAASDCRAEGDLLVLTRPAIKTLCAAAALLQAAPTLWACSLSAGQN